MVLFIIKHTHIQRLYTQTYYVFKNNIINVTKALFHTGLMKILKIHVGLQRLISLFVYVLHLSDQINKTKCKIINSRHHV